MISLKDAVIKMNNKIKENNRIISCDETEKYYLFEIVPRRWDGNIHDYPCGGTSYYIEKQSGNYCEENSMKLMDELLPEYENNSIKKINIYPFLSDEDAEFSKSIINKREVS